MVNAQDIRQKRLVWTAHQVTDQQSKSSRSYDCQFKSRETSIEWIQKSGEVRAVYNIVEAKGEWPNIALPGSIEFLVERKGKSGRIRFERTESNVFVTLDFSQPGGQAFVQKFEIKSVQ